MTSGVTLKQLRDLRADERGATELHIADVFFAKKTPTHPNGYSVRFSRLARLCLNASIADREELCAVSDAVLLILRRLVAPEQRIAHVASRIKLMQLQAQIQQILEKSKERGSGFLGGTSKERSDTTAIEWADLLVDINAQLIGFAMAWAGDSQMLSFTSYKRAGSDAAQSQQLPITVSRINKIARNLQGHIKLSTPVVNVMPADFGYITPNGKEKIGLGELEAFLKTLKEKIDKIVSWDLSVRGSDKRTANMLNISAILTLANLVADVKDEKRPFKLTLAVDTSFGGMEVPIHERLRQAAAQYFSTAANTTEELLKQVRLTLAQRASDEDVRAAAMKYFHYIMSGEYESNGSQPDGIARRTAIYSQYRQLQFGGVIEEAPIDDTGHATPDTVAPKRRTCARAAYLTYKVPTGPRVTRSVICYLIPASMALYSLPIDPEAVFDRPFKAPFTKWKPDGTTLDEDTEDLAPTDKTLGGEIKAAFNEELVKNVLSGLYFGKSFVDAEKLAAHKQMDGKVVLEKYRKAQGWERVWWQTLYFHLAKSPTRLLDTDYLVQLVFPDDDTANNLTSAQKMQLKIEGVRLIMNMRSTIVMPGDSLFGIGELGETDRIWLNAMPDGILTTPNNLDEEQQIRILLSATQYDYGSAKGYAKTYWDMVKTKFASIIAIIGAILADKVKLRDQTYIKAVQASSLATGEAIPLGIATANSYQTVNCVDDVTFLNELQNNASIPQGAIMSGEGMLLIKAPLTVKAIKDSPAHFVDALVSLSALML